MTTDTRRATGLKRSSTALGAAVLVLGSLALGACSKTGSTDSAGTAARAIGAAPMQQDSAAGDGDTIDLVSAAVETPALDSPAVDHPTRGAAAAAKGDRKGLRARMHHALHGTWVTEGTSGPVTHQAIRGDVTAVSKGSITVRAKDGFSQTLAVGADTKVRVRSNGTGADSTIGAVPAGAKAIVIGIGATNPTARLVVFKVTTSQPGGSPSPSTTS